MLVKLIFIPALMVGCAQLLDLTAPLGRAAVLLAALPVSPGVFSVMKVRSLLVPSSLTVRRLDLPAQRSSPSRQATLPACRAALAPILPTHSPRPRDTCVAIRQAC